LCGITGVYNINSKERQNNKTIKKMTDCLTHRGPDDSGTYIDDKIALGHKRLKIIDLTKKAHQPMSDRKKEIFVAFNGEIYNFQEIKNDLLKKGYSFKSSSDTEVIIYAYKAWGIKCIEKFNGMFAFALYDKKQDKLYLVRDRLGIKPLFYTMFDEKIIFSSEIKAILKYPQFKKEPNWKAISSYLSYRYVIGKETFFGNIYSLLPAHYLEIKGGVMREVEYWDVPLIANKNDMGKKFYMNKIKELLTNSVKLRMVSDVPLGAYLSGGLDSSIIVALMSNLTNERVKTYSIAFKQKEYNELKYAKLVANRYKTNHKEILINTKKYLETMSNLIGYKDAPLAVPNEIPLYLMSKILKKDITVVLSGEGADEIFSGYGRLFRSPFDYYRLKMIPYFIRKLFFKSLVNKYNKKNLKKEIDHFLFLYSYFPLEEKKKLFNNYMQNLIKGDYKLKNIFQGYFDKASDLNYHDKISYIFEKLHLVGLLGRVDNSTMATSVEARVPFVDHKLIEFMFSVPYKYKLKWKSPVSFIKGFFKNTDEISENLDVTKYILRETFKNSLPPDVLKRKKKGFPVPLDMWFKGEFVDYAKKHLLDPKSRIKKIINQQNLSKWIDLNIKLNKDPSFGHKVWALLNVEIWLKKYFD